MKLTAVGEQVIIKEHHADRIGMIIIPDQAKQYNADYYGEIIAIGKDNKYDLKIGDKIFYPRHEGIDLTHEGVDYKAMQPKHIWGLIYD